MAAKFKQKEIKKILKILNFKNQQWENYCKSSKYGMFFDPNNQILKRLFLKNSMLLENEKIKIRPLISSDVTKDYFNWFKDKLIKKYVVNTTYKDINHLKSMFLKIVKRKIFCF